MRLIEAETMNDKLLNLKTEIELLNDEEAFASVSLNPRYQWAKIVVTDDQPNVNKQKVPIEEFENLIKTGILSPIKMEYGKIAGHEEAVAKPIGVISQMVQESNKLIALAALWKREREEDITVLKKMYTDGTPPQVSWEISYAESEIDDDGVETLKGTILNGLAIVSRPAYAGRTPFVAMSSDNNEEETQVEELEQAKAKVAELETALSEKVVELEKKEEELTALKEFKAEVEDKEAKAEKMKNILKKFEDAGISKEDTYFEENKEKLLGMSEELLDFMIQELVAFSENHAEASTKNKIPNVPATSFNLSDPKELARALRESNK